jgi:hypothetical protein
MNVSITSVDKGCYSFVFYFIALVLKFFLNVIVMQWLIDTFVTVNM